MNKGVILHMPCVALAALLTVSAAAANLVPEGKRDFDVPFKGAGQMSLVYTPVFFQKGTAGVVVSGEAKWDDVVRGEKNWFDARIMTDFIDSKYKKVKGGPAIGGWHGKGGEWRVFRKSIKVPEGAEGIAMMPCLFNVKSGALARSPFAAFPSRRRKSTRSFPRRRRSARPRRRSALPTGRSARTRRRSV